MLYLFDLDGTLISGYMDNPDKDYYAWQPLPGRGARIAELRRAGHIVGIVTNQAGVAFGHITEADWEDKIADVCHRLRLDWEAVYVCFADSRSSDPRYQDASRRKPSGAMIKEAMTRYAYSAQETLYVGDRPEDEAAAADAGVAFQWAEEFFR
jgi:D-glycero-D-manno-heptose 1,7-bisphosphate phosphatase